MEATKKQAWKHSRDFMSPNEIKDVGKDKYKGGVECHNSGPIMTKFYLYRSIATNSIPNFFHGSL